MTTRRIRPRSNVSPAQQWAALADELRHVRRLIADAHAATTRVAVSGVVSAETARPRLTNRSSAAATEACQALMEWEQTLRNEAARVERRITERAGS